MAEPGSQPPLPLYARLRDELRARILDGELKPHDKLPSEAEMTQIHGVSRITVRQALGDLQKEGLIVRMQGKGAFVSHPRAVESLDRLQGLGEALATAGQAVHSKRLSMKPMRASQETARELDLPAGSSVWQLMTLRYVDREPMSVNTSYFPPAIGERLAKTDLSGRDIVQVLERDLGLAMGEANVDISACETPAREARWLKVDSGSPALRVHRVVRAAQGHPLHTETALYRADAFSYKLTLRR